MEEVPFQSLVAGGADLLMECEEEELEVWPQSPGREEEEEREEEQEEWHDEGEEADVSPVSVQAGNGRSHV